MVKEYNSKIKRPINNIANSAYIYRSFFSISFLTSQITKGYINVRESWFLDTISLVYVYNQRSWFLTYSLLKTSLKIGDGATPVKGIRKVILIGIGPNGLTRVITLSNALYSPNFYANLVLYAVLKEKGALWDEIAEYIRDPIGKPVVTVRLVESLKI